MRSTIATLHRRRAAPPVPGRRARGFTLLELMVVVAIVVVLLVVAIPSMRDLLQRNRVAGEINSMVGDLQFARSEALQRGVPVSVCPSSDGSTCLGSNTWQSGWIVFVDLNATGALDNAADVVLRRRAAWAQGDTFVAIPAITSVIYGGQGFAVNLTATTMPVHTTPPNGNATQCLSLNAVGHLSVQSPGVGTCS